MDIKDFVLEEIIVTTNFMGSTNKCTYIQAIFNFLTMEYNWRSVDIVQCGFACLYCGTICKDPDLYV